MDSVTRRQTLVGASAALVATTTIGQAQGLWPSRAVRIVVPVAAGTATDLTARIFGDALAKAWGHAVVVDNRPGADGLVAIGGFVNARDDHTLLFSFSTAVSLNPLVHVKLPYDPDVDLVPITTTAEVQFGIAVNTSVPVGTISELAGHVRRNPDKLNWAAAPGLPRFVFERYRRSEALQMVYVPYVQTGAAVQDLGEGRLQAMIASVGSLVPVLQAGKAKLMVIASADRSALSLDVPSAREAGIADLIVPAVGCVYGWKGMSADLRDRLAREIDLVAQDQSLITRLGQIGQIVRRSTPQDLARLLIEQRRELLPLAAAMAGEKH